MPAKAETYQTGEDRTRKSYEFTLTDSDFHFFKDLIYQLAGISLTLRKKDLVYSRLARLLRVKQLASFGDYIELLKTDNEKELEEFTNALTTNLTSFFREAHHFGILADYLETLSRTAPIHIWTCAASTGEEPYSIAMTVIDHFQSFSPPVRILATDIDSKVLEKARNGIYPIDQLQSFNASKIKKFFLKGSGKNIGLAKVRPELQQMITFKKINLLDECWPLQEKFAAIFCRNVMIYFDKDTQYKILKKLQPHLESNGLLFAGHSENFHHAADLFKVCGKTVYIPKN